MRRDDVVKPNEKPEERSYDLESRVDQLEREVIRLRSLQAIESEDSGVIKLWDGHTALSDICYTDLNVSSAGLRIPAALAPTEITWLTDLRVYSFASGELVHLDGVQLPHNYVPETDLLFHVHFANDTNIADGETVVWTLIYSIADPFSGFPATVTATTTFTNNSETRSIIDASQKSGTTILTDTHLISTSAIISGAGLGLSSVLSAKLIYDSGSTSTYGGECIYNSADFHYQLNRLGSELEFSG